MKIIINQEEKQELKKVAQQYGVSEKKLWKAYIGCMLSNYFDDLYDIARENEEELKGE